MSFLLPYYILISVLLYNISSLMILQCIKNYYCDRSYLPLNIIYITVKYSSTVGSRLYVQVICSVFFNIVIYKNDSLSLFCFSTFILYNLYTYISLVNKNHVFTGFFHHMVFRCIYTSTWYIISLPTNMYFITMYNVFVMTRSASPHCPARGFAPTDLANFFRYIYIYIYILYLKT